MERPVPLQLEVQSMKARVFGWEVNDVGNTLHVSVNKGGSPMKIITAIGLSLMTTFVLAAVAPAEMGSSQESHYGVLPVPRGPLQSTKKNTLVGDMVKDKDGKNVGTLENVIIDKGTGKIEVAVIGYRTSKGKIALTPVSWRNVHVDQNGEVHLKLSESDILPGTISRDVKDMSPDIHEIVKDMQEQAEK